MVATTQTDICNMALSHIAMASITSIDASNPRAIECKKAWTIALKDTLSKHKWPFAKVVETLTLLANYTPLDWEYAYAYPSNCVRLWRVYNDATVDKTISDNFTEEYDKVNAQRVIATDVEDAYGEYTYYVTDPAIFDHAFVVAFSHRMAAEIAMALTGNAELATLQISLFNGAISEAARLAREGDKPKLNPPNRFVDSRA